MILLRTALERQVDDVLGLAILGFFILVFIFCFIASNSGDAGEKALENTIGKWSEDHNKKYGGYHSDTGRPIKSSWSTDAKRERWRARYHRKNNPDIQELIEWDKKVNPEKYCN